MVTYGPGPKAKAGKPRRAAKHKNLYEYDDSDNSQIDEIDEEEEDESDMYLEEPARQQHRSGIHDSDEIELNEVCSHLDPV